MAGIERRIRQDLAKYHDQEGTPGRRQGLGRRGRQVQEVFLARSGRGRLEAAHQEPATAKGGIVSGLVNRSAKLQNFYCQMAVLRRHKALILAKNVLYKQNHE